MRYLTGENQSIRQGVTGALGAEWPIWGDNTDCMSRNTASIAAQQTAKGHAILAGEATLDKNYLTVYISKHHKDKRCSRNGINNAIY